MCNLSHAVLSLRESDLQSSNNSSLSPYYDYCRVNKESTQPQETTYATIANEEAHYYYEIGKRGNGQYDYTVIYEDPTSPYYVVGAQALLFPVITNLCVVACSVRYTPGEVSSIHWGLMFLPW